MPDHKSWLLASAVVLCCLARAQAGLGKCRLKSVNHRARQVDQFGYACEGDVKIKSCGGFCLSSEVPHWQFPYKQSRHPVCQHDKVKHRRTLLTDCHPKADPSTSHYHYIEAISCKCKACASETTSCEWLPLGSTFLDNVNTANETDEDDFFVED